MQPVIESELDERRWLWLQRMATPERLQAAFRQLGNRRPYPKNLARAMGLEWPADDLLPRTAAQQAAGLAAFEAHRPRLQKIVEEIKARQGGA